MHIKVYISDVCSDFDFAAQILINYLNFLFKKDAKRLLIFVDECVSNIN